MKIFVKYYNFSNFFSLYSTVELLEYTKIDNHFINLLNDKQLLYGLIQSLKLVKLKILKIYIKTNLARSFIKPFKSFVFALILCIQKKNYSFYLYINY